MDLFRRKQKLIFWIVTIIIVPSFVLVWGIGGMGDNRAGGDFQVGQVSGKSVSYAEFEAFQKRLRAALGGIPLQFAAAPGAGTQAEEIYKYLFAYQVLQDAERAGIRASDLQVGTYLDNAHPTVSQVIRADDPQSRERAVDEVCRQMQISRAEFVRGLREWQTIGNYLDADANLTAVNDETVYSFYSLNKSQVMVKRIRFVESDGVKEEAKAAIMNKPEAELQEEVRAHIAANADQLRYREPARWRFAYVFSPNVPADSVRQPTEAEIRDAYEQGKTQRYNDAPLSEVRDRIRAELVQQEVDRQTIRNFNVDIDPQLRGPGAELSLAELANLTPLVKYNVTAKDTGAEPIPAADVVRALPGGVIMMMQQLLDSIEMAPAAIRDRTIEEWKSGWDMSGRPFKAEDGFYRLRLLDYVPSVPANLDTPEDGVAPEYYEKAIEDMVGARAEEIILEESRKMEERLREYFAAKERGEPVPDEDLAREFEAMPVDTISYLQIADSMYELGRLPIGDMMGPTQFRDPATGEVGQELVVVVDRRVPSRATFNAEPEEVKGTFRQIAQANYQGNYGFTYSVNGPAAVIQPSPAIMAGLADRYNRGELRVNPELLRTGDEG
ncbi:MAG: SurA N-terminal domain-containing protein [Planctomycetaceae bacterium]|nr:SurA N-terminal domain-containing protein [Planctomycetaceae bacterium]